MANFLMALLLAIFTSHAFASDLCPSTSKKEEWSVDCFEGVGELRRVKDAFLDRLSLNEHGKAVILIGDPRELLAVDRYGKVVVPNIRHAGDFDYPEAFHGIGRFSMVRVGADGGRIEKCGYFKAPQFQVLVAPDFDQCDAFNEEGAYVCRGCASYCSDAACHNRHFIGGRGFLLDAKGNVKKEFIPKTLDNFCRRPDLVRVTKLDPGALMIHCDGPSDNPFTL